MAAAGMLQCHRCGRMGHTAKNCSRPPDCFRCGQPHYARDCPSAPRPACYKCGRTTHLARDCPTGINCYKCGQTGHFAKDCTHRPRQPRRDEQVVTASQLPPVFCSHCKRRGHVASQCTAGELQEYDDFKDSLNITPDMLLLGNVKRKRPAGTDTEGENKDEGKKGDKKRLMTTQILIVPKKKKGATTSTKSEANTTQSVPVAQPREEQSSNGKRKEEEEGEEGSGDEENGGGLSALMANYGDSDEDDDPNEGTDVTKPREDEGPNEETADDKIPIATSIRSEATHQIVDVGH